MDNNNPFNSSNPLAEAAMASHREAIRHVRVDHSYAYNSDALLTDKPGFMAANGAMVLDVGQSTRDQFRFTDCYRLSRYGMAWLLRDFSDVTLYSIRGPYSAIFNRHRSWKKSVEKRFGMARRAGWTALVSVFQPPEQRTAGFRLLRLGQETVIRRRKNSPQTLNFDNPDLAVALEM